MIVTLTRGELLEASRVGAERQVEAIVNGRKPRYPFRNAGEGFACHIVGAIGEVAVAKATNRFWSPLHDDPRRTEDLKRIEVRSSVRTDSPLRAYAKDTAPYYALAIVETLPEVVLVGWTTRRSALVEDYAAPDNPGAFLVPQGDLIPFDQPSIAQRP